MLVSNSLNAERTVLDLNTVPVGHVVGRTATGIGAIAQSGGGAEELDDLTDVALASPVDLQLLRYDGSGWVNADVNIEDLANVRSDSPLNAGNILQYDGTEWANTILRFDDGSALAPSITFTGDIYTGVYRDADDSVGVAAGGVQVASFSQLMPRIGIGAGVNVTGSGCIAIGNFALDGTHNPNTVNCIAIGQGALSANMAAVAPSNSVGIGVGTLANQTSATGNTAVGHGCLPNTAGASNNTAFGNLAGANIAGNRINTVSVGSTANALQSGSVAIGQACIANGADSITIGRSAGSSTMGARCIAIGTGAMDGTHTAANCNDVVAIGHGALTSNMAVATPNCQTVAVGQNALAGQTTANSNTAVGYDSGGGIATGNRCTFVGRAAAALSDVSDLTVLGSGALGGVANGLFFQTSIAAQTGGLPLNYNTADGRAGPNTSSILYKTDVTLAPLPVDDENGLSVVDKLRVIEYVGRNAPNDDKILGIIAEEAAEHVHPSLIPRDEDGAAFGIDYARLSCVLIQEVQKLRRDVAVLKGKPLPELPSYVPVVAADIYPAEKLMDDKLAEQKQQGKTAEFMMRVRRIVERIEKRPANESTILAGLNKRTRDAVLKTLEDKATAEAAREAALAEAEAARLEAEAQREADERDSRLDALARKKMAAKVDLETVGAKMKARIEALLEKDRLALEVATAARLEAEEVARLALQAAEEEERRLEEEAENDE